MNIHLYRLYHCIRWKHILFPKASERRVLLLVGVCYIHLQTSSHLRIFWSSHLLIFSSYIFTSSHLHIFLISHLLILHLHIFSSSHLFILTSSHLHTFTSFIFTSSHLFILSSSHLRIFSFSHLHIFSSSHLRIFSLLLSYPLALSPCCLLALLPSSLSFFSISLLRRGTVPTRRHEMQPFRTKWGSIVKNWDKLAISNFRRNYFGRNEFRLSKTEVKLRFSSVRRNFLLEMRFGGPSCNLELPVQWGLVVESWSKFAI